MPNSFQISIEPLSSEFISYSSNYVNLDRNLNNLYSEISGNYFFNFSENIQDIYVDKNHTLFLTDYIGLSSLLNTSELIDTYLYGYNENSSLIKYNTDLNDFSVAYSNYINNQFLIVLNDSISVFPLKTFEGQTNIATFQKIYHKDKLFIQYKKDIKSQNIQLDNKSTIYFPYGVSSIDINNPNYLINNSQGGDSPVNSDLILFDTSEYNKTTDNGLNNINDFHNGLSLCLWLSANSPELSATKKWAEYWYDPKTSPSDIFTFTNPDSFYNSFSIESEKIISETEKFDYYKFGPERNDAFIKTISNNTLNLSTWNQSITSDYVSGYINNKVGVDDIFDMRGSQYAIIIPNENTKVDTDFGVSFWFNTNQMQDTQFYGNYYDNKGFGITLNTGSSPNSVLISNTSAISYNLNYRGFKILEKDIRNDLSLTASNISLVNKDLLNYGWLYDSENYSIYKMENDDIVSDKILLPSTSLITKIENSSNNNLHILDSYSSTISAFDTNCTYISSLDIAGYNNFCIGTDDSLILNTSEFLTVDNNNIPIYVIGATLFYNGGKILHLIDKPIDLRVDQDNNILLLVGNNILKCDISGNILFNIVLPIPEIDKNAALNVHASNNQFNIWVILNTLKIIIVLNSDGNILKRIPLDKIEKGLCNNYEFDVHGNFTNFDNFRKFNNNNGFINSINPHITFKAALTCKDNFVYTIQEHCPIDNFISNWTHVAVTMAFENNQTHIKIFINGKLKKTKILDGFLRISHESSNSPFVIGGYSGKLLPLNLEKATPNEFFKGYISNFNLFKTKLTAFHIRSLSMQKHYDLWKDSKIYIPIPPTTMLEEIDKFHLNRYKGYKTNRFNIKIKNFSENESVKSLIQTYLIENISDYIPTNNSLNAVIFE